MLNVIDLQLGADPEVFIFDTLEQKFLSAHTMVPGSKDKPHSTTYGAIQVDGVAAEFNILPARNLKDWLKRIGLGLRHVNSLAKASNPRNAVMIQPVATFTKSYFESLPEDVVQLGCNPDFNAYTSNTNEPPHTTEYFRTGAGHVHIGWLNHNMFVEDPLGDDKHFNDCMELVRDLDATVYPISHLWDGDTKRRTLYGQRGSFRPKKYGVEYRPLSNAWLSDPLLQAWVYNAVNHTVLLHNEGFVLSQVDELTDFSKPFTQGKTITRETALEVHNYLVDKLEYPKLPEIYLGK